MKKIFILIGSRRKKGNTYRFVKSIISNLSDFDVDYCFPQDLDIQPCVGCHNCFQQAKCVLRDDISLLEDKILSSDIFIIASPVYLHYMTGDLKKILDRLSWWTHTMRLQGKPVVVLSTNGSNGERSVTEPLSEIMTAMGGNVIANANASEFPNQINNNLWLSEVSIEISERIKQYSRQRPSSNQFLEAAFISEKFNILQQKEMAVRFPDWEFNELKFWEDTGMLSFDSYSDYLSHRLK
ncbi:flavodoxin family protein [Streptococcus gordonii]|uniref:flavodoxin family protein n=1 Tax=Streptococcus gordonii TaxID=1302 RepID=UPI0022E2489E|nr:flavodoxin family protein [Streptococcus gordonii]